MRLMHIGLLLSFTSIILSAASCWKIQNSDRRALCEAKFEGKRSCWKIQNDDVRAYCEATAEHQRSCWKIKENDLKAMCEAEKTARQ